MVPYNVSRIVLISEKIYFVDFQEVRTLTEVKNIEQYIIVENS